MHPLSASFSAHPEAVRLYGSGQRNMDSLRSFRTQEYTGLRACKASRERAFFLEENMTETEDEILTSEEAAKHLKISVQTLRKLDIPRMQSNTIIRYKLKDLDAYFEAHKTGGVCGEANG